MNELEDAIIYFEDAVRESDEIIADCSPALKTELVEQKKHFVIALDAMRRTQPANEPLTLDELREMDGEPVWAESEHRTGQAGWFLVNASAEAPHEFILFGTARSIPCAGIDTKYWRAYRRKPEGGNA